MIDISEKEIIQRIARASGKIILKKETIDKIKENQIEKGDVITLAKIASINAVKKVPDLIPFCHTIPIDNVKVDINFINHNTIEIVCTVKSFAKTGVEMEALTGVSVALLNIWDVVKRHEKNVEGQYPFTKITDIKVEEKIKKNFKENGK